MGNPRVSIIVIFLNGAGYFHEAITSVLDQSYTDWEMFLVDDGSTDASTEMAREYAQRYPDKIVYLEHPNHENRGMSASRNLGLRHVRGEFIAFIDADDVWYSQKLEQQVAAMAAHPEAAMVYGPPLWWLSWTGGPEDEERNKVLKLGIPLDNLMQPPTLLGYFLRDIGIPSPSGIMVRHTAFKTLGGFEDSFRGNYEDAVFYAKVCLTAPVYVARECWYKYRFHPASHSNVVIQEGKYHQTRRIFLEWVETYMQQHGFAQGEVWDILQRELWPYRHPRIHRVRQSTLAVGMAGLASVKRLFPLSFKLKVRQVLGNFTRMRRRA